MSSSVSGTSSICAVIATHNRRELLRRLLSSLGAQTYRDFDVVVVDNASTDGTAEMVRSDFPSTHLIALDSNTGASGGNNTGLRYALGKGYRYCWLLDNDCVAAPDALEALVHVMDHRPEIAMAASKVLVLDGSGRKTATVHEVGGSINWVRGSLISCGNGLPDDDSPVGSFSPAEYVAMTSLLLRKPLLEQHGLLREEFFVFGEDVDLSLRYRRLGYQVAAVPASRVWHLQGAHKSTTPLREYYAARNYLFLFWQYAPWPFKIACVYHQLARVLNLMLIFAADGQHSLARAIRAAVLAFYRGRLVPFDDTTRDAEARSEDIRVTEPPESILVISRAGMSELADVLGRVRSAFPQSEIDVLFLHYFNEELDLSPYRVRTMLVRPPGKHRQLALVWRLMAWRYDATVATGPSLTLLYESAARHILEWRGDRWGVRRASLVRKIAERVVAAAASRIGAAVLILALPLRAVLVRLANR